MDSQPSFHQSWIISTLFLYVWPQKGGFPTPQTKKSCTREPKHQKQPRPTLAPVGTSQTESCTNTPAAPKLAKRFKPTRAQSNYICDYR